MFYSANFLVKGFHFDFHCLCTKSKFQDWINLKKIKANITKKKKPIPSDDAQKFIVIKGARSHNLKNININILKYKLVVFTGVSGSGKSSLVFDTIYAEGQRRYVESLSSYARQFLEKMNQPDVDSIWGLAPSMAIEQKSTSRNSRSTVGTTTEIYDYLRLLFARIGDTHSPISGKIVKKDTPASIVKELTAKKNVKLYVLTDFNPIKIPDSTYINNLREKGFYKLAYKNDISDLNDISDGSLKKMIDDAKEEKVYVVIDRMSFNGDDSESVSRLTESLETAFIEGNGYLTVRVYNDEKFSEKKYNKYFAADGMTFEEPEPRMFSFNNPFGACKKCQGFGRTMDIDFDLVIPDKNRSIMNNAIAPFATPKHSVHLTNLILESDQYGISLNKPIKALSDKEIEYIFKGGKKYIGIYKFFKTVEREALYKLHYRVLLNRYRAYTTCSDCGGGRLRKEVLYIKVGGKTIFDVVRMTIKDAYDFFLNLKLDRTKKEISSRILEEILNRLKYLVDVGLVYLTLDRLSSTLSGGEAQRINLATSLGSSLVGSIYVLDEPSVGLHPRDNEKLINIMKSLRDLGNTVLVVEHDKDMIREADEIVDVGLNAGESGGEIIFQGNYEELKNTNTSLTAKYLKGLLKIESKSKNSDVKDSDKFLTVKGARANNLKDITVKIPVGYFTCVTGVSGSGKSTLVNNVIYGAMKKKLEGYYEETIGDYDEISGYETFESVEMIDQSQIGKTTRSNPVTYIKAFDIIREAFASSPLAKRRGFDNGTFSFNVPGGRCEMCEGAGVIKVEMQFMADIYLECESCGGKRYKSDTLEVKLQGNNGLHKNIHEILELTVTEAIKFFKPFPKIIKKLKVLDDVGLGYIKLGQSGSTLSGGESQRVKLAYHLVHQAGSKNTLYIFDEPTTGLHYHDISKLMKCFDALLKKGNTILVIEHNLEVIKNADYVIDLGPESGSEGGYIIGTGTPKDISLLKDSYTGKYLKEII